VSDKKILGRVLWGYVPGGWTQVLPPNPRRLTLSFAGSIGEYNVLFGVNQDQGTSLILTNNGQAVVTFTRETLGQVIGLSVWVAGPSTNYRWCVIETWEGFFNGSTVLGPWLTTGPSVGAVGAPTSSMGPRFLDRG